MALTKCPNCGKEVSDKSRICPSCNFDFAKYQKEQEDEKRIQEEAKRLQEKAEKDKIKKHKLEEKAKKKKIMEENKKCPECKSLINIDEDNCPNCGFPIAEHKKKKDKLIHIFCVSAILLLICFLIFILIKQEINYNEANELLYKHKWQEAENVYEKLDNYKDSKELLEVARSGYAMMLYSKETFPQDGIFGVNNIRYYLDVASEHDITKDLVPIAVSNLFDRAKNSASSGQELSVNNYIDKLFTYLSATERQELRDTLTKAQDKEKEREFWDLVIYDSKYDEAMRVLDGIVNKTNEQEEILKEYSEFKEKYGKFLGDYTKQNDWRKEGFSIELRFDKKSKHSYLYISKNGYYASSLEDWQLKDISTDNNRISFQLNASGSLEPQFGQIILELENGDLKVIKDELEEQKIAYNEKEANRVPPKIGDSKEDVLESSWGSPKNKSKTTTAEGEVEIWSYSNYDSVWFLGETVYLIND
ncbi:MAG TPA: zinc ribbon domain-containing protein [Candidatus Dorea intestinavium]|nr:zinc ribbon domain-containing protein [Candidatus Dorea intestinavium]